MNQLGYVGYEGEIGLADIVGDDSEIGLEDIVGAVVAEVKKQAANGQRVRGMNRIQGLSGAQQLRNEGNSVARRQIAPIPLTTIAAGATATINFRPQRPIRAERLVLDGSAVGGVFLVDFLVGAEPQFVNSGAVPVSAFQPQAFGIDLKGNTAQPGIDVTLLIQNTTGAPVTIGGMLLGTSLT